MKQEVKSSESQTLHIPDRDFNNQPNSTKVVIRSDEKKNQTTNVVIANKPDKEDDKPLKTHPDGGWGWVVVAAAFLTQCIVVGLQNSSGVIFNELIKKYNGSRGNTGFVSSISCGMMFILGPLTTSLCQRFGCRLIAMVGGLMCVLGMVLSAHAPTLSIMYVTFGLTWGLGTSFCYFPTLIILVPYFNEKLAFVNGIVSAGAGVGTLILSPSIQWFAGNYGVKYMFYGLGLLHILILFAALLYRPLPQKYLERQGVYIRSKMDDEDDAVFSKERQYTKETLLSQDSRNQLDKSVPRLTHEAPLEDENGDEAYGEDSFDSNSSSATKQILIDLFTDKAFVAWCCGLSIFMLGYFVPFVHIVRYATVIGIPEVDAAFLISVLSIVATIFKVLSGKLAGVKRIEILKLYQVALLVMGVATTLIPVQRSYFGLLAYGVIFGMSESCFIVMIPLITKDIVGVQRLPLAIGCVFMLMGVPTVLGAPIAGWIYDAFQDYSYAFYVAGMMNIVGVLIMFFITYFKQEGHLRQKVLEERRKYREDKERQEAASRTIIMTSFASTERIYLSNRDLMNPYEDPRKFSSQNLTNTTVIPRNHAQQHVSRIIEFTSFASSERIYLSSRDLLNNPYPSSNNLRGNTLDRMVSRHHHRSITRSTDIFDGFSSLPPARPSVVDGFASLPHPRSNSDGSKKKLSETESIIGEDVKIDGTGFCARTRRPLSLQLTPSSQSTLYEHRTGYHQQHQHHVLPMPRTLDSIRKEAVIEEEEEPEDPCETLQTEPCDQHPDSPTLTRFVDRRDFSRTSSTTRKSSFVSSSGSATSGRSRSNESFLGFWGRLMKNTFPKHERGTFSGVGSHTTTRPNEIYIIEERLAVV